MRFARARKASAVHLHPRRFDSAQRRAGRGRFGLYVVAAASDAEAARLAEVENKSDVIAGVDLTSEPNDVANILIDLAQRETKAFSLQFARDLVGEFKIDHAAAPASVEVGGFIVLKAPDVPSVLVELGYMSTKDDLVHLMSPDWRSRTADSVVHAVDTFFAPRMAGQPWSQLRWVPGLSFNIKPRHQKPAPQPWAEGPAAVAGP